jgi:mRNA-degrading endonuclease RelE of RelBE toxin-antitoxin system
MDKISKTLAKLTIKEKELIAQVFAKIEAGKTSELDIKKLKGYDSIYRARFGKWRIIYRAGNKGEFFIVSFGRRNDNTYNF